MKIFTFIILLFTVNMFASDVTLLQEKYNEAVAKAIEPINKVYVVELQKLLEKESKLGNFDEIAKITEELKRITPVEPLKKVKNDLESLFVNKSWKTPTGTSFHFARNGQGFRQFGIDKTILVWKIDGDIVEVQAQLNQAGAIKIWFFKFIDRKTAKYGDTTTTIIHDLIPE